MVVVVLVLVLVVVVIFPFLVGCRDWVDSIGQRPDMRRLLVGNLELL